MRAVVQRVRSAQVLVGGEERAAISQGLLVLVGVKHTDQGEDAAYIANKIAGLRIFADQQDKMNCSVAEVGGEVLVVSQFTLYGDCRKGRRPGFAQAAAPEVAQTLYLQVLSRLQEQGLAVKSGVFQSQMVVELQNDGPVTILLDSERGF